MQNRKNPPGSDFVIPFRKLGATELRITPIGLGAWQFSEGKGGAIGSWAPLDPEVTDSIVAAAIQGGMNWFDTAELYGFGRSERGLARALTQLGIANGEVLIATKWSPFMRTAGSLKRTFPKRVANLAPFGVDLHQVHFPMSFSSIQAEMNAMADLLDEGKIRAVGVSNFSAQQMQRAHKTLVKRGYFLASNQVKYSALDRRIERNGILSAAKEMGITIIAYSPLEMGLLSGKFHKDPSLLRRRPWGRRLRLRRLVERSRDLIALLEEIGAIHEATVSQVALNWLINSHGELVVTIPGASKPHHARESALAMRFTLSESEIRQIDEISLPG